jgi:HlyD family secretion protein
MVEADLAFERAAELLRRDLTSQAALDQARATRDQRHAAAAASRAMLDELQAGTRPEQIDQAAAEVAAQAADLDELRESRNRLTLKAPRAGRVDALPFEPGDQPAAGATLVSLLVGELPYARIFVPAHIRAGLSEGDRFSVEVLGVERRFAATLRSISREASFTPYYALSGDDASRTVFRAELHFTEPAAADLPAGLPLTATPLVPGAADD